MSQSDIACPHCGSRDVLFSKKQQAHICEDCTRSFTAARPFTPLRIFLSYGHDEYASVAGQLKQHLEERGHQVWFDLERLKPGGDWEIYIEEGLNWVAQEAACGRVVLLLTPHSVRRPDGYCLNEIARALNRRLRIVPIMVVWCEPPLSICRIQWLDLRDCLPLHERPERYQTQRDLLIRALEEDRLDFEGVQARLYQLLQPLPFDADIQQHLPRFTGRRWLVERLESWLADAKASRVFWIRGAPGIGKTALAAWLCAHRREVAAFHLCRHGHDQKADPRHCVLSLAYQLGSQLPDYQMRLSALPLEKLVADTNARTLFDALIVQPLCHHVADPGRPIVILIDALDEATRDGKNELASFLASEFDRTPSWLRLVLTSRAEPEVQIPLQGLTPYCLEASTPDNRADLRDYLNRELKALTPDGQVPAEAIETILRLSEGLFLYVEWVRQELSQGRLSLQRPETFPQGLGGVYVQFFERQFADRSAYVRQVRPVLDALLAAREPLEMALLADLFAWNEYQRIDFQKALGSLFPVHEGRVQAFHRTVREWLNDPEQAGPYFVSGKEGHKFLAEQGWRLYQREARRLPEYFLRHLPHHLLTLQLWDELERLLLDWDFLQARVQAGLLLTAIDDLAEASVRLPAETAARPLLRLAAEALRADLHFIVRHPHSLFQCLWNRCWWYDCSEAARHYEVQADRPASGPWQRSGAKLHELLEHWRSRWEKQTPAVPWLRALRPLPDRLGAAQEAVFRGHTGAVLAVAVSSDGRRIASASADHTLRIWDVDRGLQLACLMGHQGAVNAVAFSAEGRRLLSGSQDGSLRLWDVASGKETKCLRFNRALASVAFSPDGQRLLSGSTDHTLRICDAASGALLARLFGHTGRIHRVAWSADGQYLASASEDGTVRLWDAGTNAPPRRLLGHEAGVRDVAFAPDSRRLFSASEDRTIRLWDVERGEELACLRGHGAGVRCLAVAPDASRIASAHGTIRLWDGASGVMRGYLRGHDGSIAALVFLPGGQRLASASRDGTIRLWDVADALTPALLQSLPGHLRCLAFSADGRWLAAASVDRTVGVWQVPEGTLRDCLSGHEKLVRAMAFAPDGRTIVLRGEDDSYWKWQWTEGASQAIPCQPSDFPASTSALPYPWRLDCGPLETELRCRTTNELVAAFPARFAQLAAHPTEPLWAAAAGWNLYLLRLERSPR